MSYTIRTTCRLCDAPLPDERVLDLGCTPLANALVAADRLDSKGDIKDWDNPEESVPLCLKQCTTCGHVQLPVVVDPKLLFPADYPYASATGASMREHLRRMAAELGEDVDRDELVVEIGSNDGYLLGEFRKRGGRTIGIDPAAKLAASATVNGDLTFPYFFAPDVARAIRNACGPAMLIVANNVFAHADNLDEIVEGVKVLLDSNHPNHAHFVFEVGYLPDVLRANNFGTVYHEHLSYHTLRPLMRFFARHELGLYDAHRVETQGGSIRCFVRRTDARCSARLVALLDAEDASIGEAIPGWQLRVNAAATRFREQLIWRKSQGKSIAAYGCSAKSTTLLHVAGIGRETIDWIADDNPLKQGRFSPGKHIPIVPGSWLEEKQPDYCVSLSENFSEAFKAAHPGYRGEWIEPGLT